MIEIKDVTLASSTLKLSDPLQFKLTFDAFSELDELSWRVTYTPEGDSGQEDIDHEQELEVCCVGPVPKGVNMFELEAAAPPLSSLGSDLIGRAVLLLCGSYHEQDFITVGYMVRTEFEEGPLREQWEAAQADDSEVQAPKARDNIDKLVRVIGVDKPRVTKVAIKWDVAGQGEWQDVQTGTIQGAPMVASGPQPFASLGQTV